MASFWDNIRKDFVHARPAIYLDHAAGGPIPVPVRSRVKAYLDELASEADFAWPKWMKRVEECRSAAAKFINAEPEEIAFIHGTSQGMNLIAELLSSQGQVLTNTSEFPSSTIPWLARNAELIFQEPEKNIISLQKLATLLSPAVKTVLTSHVQYATGFRQDLTRLGRMKGKRYLVVNATQSLGSLEIDVKAWNADFLCSNSYKWLMAGYGGGILFVRKKWLSQFAPQSSGWRSVANPDSMDNRRYKLLKSAARYEFGCPSFGTIFAVGAAVNYLSQIGMKKIENRIMSLTAHAMSELKRHGFEIASPEDPVRRSGIVVFKVARAEKIWKRLISQKIFVSARGQGLRLGPHFYNTHDEIDKFITKLDHCRDMESRPPT